MEFSIRSMSLMKFNSNRFILQEGLLNKWSSLQLNIVNVVQYYTAEKAMQVLTELDLYYDEDPNKARFLETSLSADFSIDNASLFMTDGKIEFPTEFISSIVEIMYSTLRGVILDKTILSGNIILPLVDPNELHREVMIIPPDSEAKSS